MYLVLCPLGDKRHKALGSEYIYCFPKTLSSSPSPLASSLSAANRWTVCACTSGAVRRRIKQIAGRFAKRAPAAFGRRCTHLRISWRTHIPSLSDSSTQTSETRAAFVQHPLLHHHQQLKILGGVSRALTPNAIQQRALVLLEIRTASRICAANAARQPS